MEIAAVAKAAIVFSSALALSWLLIIAMRKLPLPAEMI
jgi:hypothetical protein